MRKIHSPGRSRLLLLPALATTIVLAGTWLGTPNTPAGAAFPGKNGRITFASDRVTPDNPQGDDVIFTTLPDGTGLTQLTFNAASDYDPVWSADGTAIIFVSERDGNLEIHTMRTGGADQTNRTTHGATDVGPDRQPRRRG